MKTPASYFILLQAFIFTIFLNFQELKSQSFYEWESKTFLTDSVSDNTNPDIAVIEYVTDPSLNMVWENSTDEGSTAIFYKDLLQTSGPQVVISETGVHFSHPKLVLVNYDSPGENFYVFYQTDQSGNEDIYYKKYGTDGQFSEAFAFATSDENEENFISETFTYMGSDEPDRYIVKTMVWTSAGKLMTCDLEKNGDEFSFSEPVLLDDGSCSDSYIYSNQIFYIKEDGNERFIYYIFRQYPTYEWSAPSVYFDQGNCYNLSGDNVMPQYLTWSADSAGVFKNYIANTYSQYNGYRIGPESDTPLDPAICTIILPVAPEPLQFFDFYMAFPYPDNGTDEIFMNPFYMSPEFENFSMSGTSNRNPEFFTGELVPGYDWCFYDYLVWEEYRNGHWQIFSSKTEMCVGGINDEEDNQLSLNAFPNPFKNDIVIKFDLPYKDLVKIDIYDLFGRKVDEVFSGMMDKGSHEITWNAEDLSKGIYLIRVQASESESSIRVVKQD
jgi:hypothetical protein